MINIQEKSSQVEALRSEIGAVKFFSNKFKKLREWQVLCATESLLRQAGEYAPRFAAESESPDFILYGHGSELSYAEVVEAIRPDYLRNKFHKEDAQLETPRFYDVDPPLTDPWSTLRCEISKKAPAATTLIAYYDLPRSTFRAWDVPFNELLLGEHATRPFQGVGSFERVLVLNCDMKSLIELAPQARTIVPDNPFGE
jgi:hypothetical protein